MKRSEKSRSIIKKSTAALTLVLSVCLIAGAAAAGQVFAAGNTYKSPLSGKTYTIDGRFSNCIISNGIDISAWQSTGTNWTKTKNAGVDFAIIRVTYTNYGPKDLKLNNDSDFAQLYREANAAGVMKGVYVFSQAKTASEAVKEADFAVKRLKSLGIGPEDLELPVYMDYEFSGGILGRMYGISRTEATNSAVAFCNRIKSYGYTPGVYANLSFCNNQLDLSRFAADVDIWCAQYYSSCGLKKAYSKWQYSSDGSVGGFGGNIDKNFWFLNNTNTANSLIEIKKSTAGTSFSIYEGETLLKEGKDYIRGSIRNNVNTANVAEYIYVKGIGKYGGYALIPTSALAAASGVDGEDTEEVVIDCANYLSYASSAMSSYLNVNAYAKATKIKTLKGKKKGFYVKVAKKSKSNASGYQMRYSRSKDMSGSATKTIGSKYNKVSKTIKTGVRKKTYYVQVRTYKDAGGLRFYSGWSAVRKVKTK